FGGERLAFVDGDDAVLADLFHGFGEHLADFDVAVAGDGADLSHLLRRLDLDRHLLEFGGDILNRLLDALLHLARVDAGDDGAEALDRKSTRLNSSHVKISYAVFCLKKKKQ